MSHEPIVHALHHLRRLAARSRLDELSDRELLRRFADAGDQDAYAEVFRRHAGLVLATCRRWLTTEQDAEDAFQAVFLILAKKAGALAWRESIAGWLHRVALLVSRKQARAGRARQARERQAAPSSAAVTPNWDELQQTLDEELARLPDAYRAPILLCCLAELSQDEAARQLGVTEAALRGRLWRGREMLRDRLARRGMQVGAAMVAGTLAQQQAVAGLTTAFVTTTLRAGAAYLTDNPMTDLVSGQVLDLARGGMHAMMMGKLKAVGLAVVVVGLVALGGVGATQQAGGTKEVGAKAVEERTVRTSRRYKSPEDLGITGEVVAVDETGRRITVHPRGQAVKLTFDLAKDVQVSIADEPGKLAELKKKDDVVLMLGKDDKTVVAVLTWPEDQNDLTVKAVSVADRTVKVARENEEDATIPVRDKAVVVLDGFLAELKHLEAGMSLNVLFGRDGKTATRVFATWVKDGDVTGRVRALDEAGGKIQVDNLPDGDEDRIYQAGVTKDTKVFVNGEPAKLADVKTGMAVMMRLDRAFKHVETLRAWQDE